jgi:hypothetical protein
VIAGELAALVLLSLIAVREADNRYREHHDADLQWDRQGS